MTINKGHMTGYRRYIKRFIYILYIMPYLNINDKPNE